MQRNRILLYRYVQIYTLIDFYSTNNITSNLIGSKNTT